MTIDARSEDGGTPRGSTSRSSGSLRSIQTQLLLLAVLPILIILPLGIRGAATDLDNYLGEQSQAAAAESLADLTVLEKSLRAEWLAGLDLSGLSSNVLLADSELAGEVVAAAFTQDVTSNYERAVERTDESILATRENPGEALTSLLDDLDATRERVRSAQVIPAEVDLYFSRLIAEVGGQRAIQSNIVSAQSSPNERVILDRQIAIGRVADDAGALQRNLTLTIDSLIVDRQVNWLEIDDFADTLIDSIDDLPSDIRTEYQIPELRETAFDVREVVSNQATQTDLGRAELATVFSEQRRLLVAASDTTLEASSGAFVQLVEIAEAERTAARNALILSALLVALALIVGLLGVSRGRTRIAEPLRSTAETARRVLDGEIPREGIVIEGPLEVRDVSSALGDLVSTIATVNAQAHAISNAAIDDESLNRRLPGKLGRNLERTIGSWRDTTLRLEHEVSHDPLTNLASPRRFAKAATDHAGTPLTLALISIDGFKAINDTAGKQVGDEGLLHIARRLELHQPEGTTLARLWSDEFALLGTDHDAVVAAATNILDAAREPLVLGSHRYRVSSTIGIAQGLEVDQLVSRATLATREGKANGGNQCVSYDDAFVAHLKYRAQIEGELVEALTADPTTGPSRMGDPGLKLWLQPIVDLHTGKVQSLEALVRWQMDDGSLRMPNDFVPIAEQSQLSIDLDAWVIRAACALLNQLSGSDLDHLEIAVNVSGRHLTEGDVAAAVANACMESGVGGDRLAIEITESYLVADIDTVIPKLHELHELGVTLLMDDFGTGYSSLSYLQDLPFQVLKIDRSFIERASSGRAGQSIVRAITSMGSALGLTVLAEGVETNDQLSMLADMGCDQAQGFAISRPTGDLGELFIFCRDFELQTLTGNVTTTASAPESQSPTSKIPTTPTSKQESSRVLHPGEKP